MGPGLGNPLDLPWMLFICVSSPVRCHEMICVKQWALLKQGRRDSNSSFLFYLRASLPPAFTSESGEVLGKTNFYHVPPSWRRWPPSEKGRGLSLRGMLPSREAVWTKQIDSWGGVWECEGSPRRRHPSRGAIISMKVVSRIPWHGREVCFIIIIANGALRDLLKILSREQKLISLGFL